ncbi:MAG: thymidine phosphorylase [Actinomycetota bacterium]|nr:thymidine phosphorylase [Actinomycetota bacterium]
MRAVDVIGAKRDGAEVDAAELAWLVGGFLDGSVTEGQMAAFLMAGVLRGFSRAEARALTDVLVASGEQLDLSSLSGPTVDKHSTGGVSDATTLLVAPLLATAGAKLVKLSGRGLGHTGGTLDKLESIPGLRTGLDPEEMLRIAEEVGCVVAAQTQRLVPADKALYALRDVTGTVASTALIASSVMSKKLAAGAGTIVLDVKTGGGAFMKETAAAEELAELCVAIGREAGRRCAAIVSAMDQPLGRAVGNALEVAEAVELLAAAPQGRLAEVALELATLALVEARGGGEQAASAAGGEQAAKAAGGEQAAKAAGELRHAWTSGAALETLARMIVAQGGDGSVCERPRDVLPAAPVIRDVVAEEAGSVAAVPALPVGELAAVLGAGRSRQADEIDPAVGIELRVEVGDRVEAGAVLAVVHARDEPAAQHARERLGRLINLGGDPTAPATVLRRIGGG